MTDETRAELRRFFAAMVRVAECETLTVEVIGSEPSGNPWARVSAACQVRESKARPGSAPELPSLTTAQQLALSVLLGEPVPLAVLLGACEDAGAFPAGVLEEVRRRAYEQGKADGKPFSGFADSMARLNDTVRLLAADRPAT